MLAGLMVVAGIVACNGEPLSVDAGNLSVRFVTGSAPVDEVRVTLRNSAGTAVVNNQALQQVSANTFEGTFSNLDVGLHSIVVKALETSQVTFFGTGSVTIQADQTVPANVTASSFIPILTALINPSLLTLQVDFQPVANATQYQVEIATDAGFTTGVQTTTTQTTSATVSVSDPGTYFARVAAGNADVSFNEARPSASLSHDIVNILPAPTISSPTDGSSFLESASISLQGSATDAESGAIPDASLTWSSDIDGTLGTGSPIAKSFLTVDTHVITLSATDSHGGTGTTTVTIFIVTDPSPGSVAGQAFRSNDGAPFAGINVSLIDAANNTTTVQTDASGNYSFTSVVAGTYTLEVQASEFPTVGQFVTPSSRAITVRGGQNLTAQDFEYQVPEVIVRTTPDVTTTGVGTEVTVTVEVELTVVTNDISGMDYSGVAGTITWPAGVATYVPGSESGTVWAGNFLTNNDAAGSLRFVGVAPTGVTGNPIVVLTFRVSAAALGQATITPTLSELELLDSTTGQTTPLLGSVLLTVQAGSVTVQ